MGRGIDERLRNIPGGNTRTKGFVAAVIVVGILAIPVFTKSSGKQGHDYLSSEKPEDIRASQEELRKQYRNQRDNK